LVDDGEVDVVELLRDGAGAHYATDVGRHHHHVLIVAALDIVEQHWRAVDVVHGYIKEALDLLRVEVNGQHTIDANAGEHVGHHASADRHPGGTYPAILPRIAKIGNDCRDATCGAAPQRVDHEQQFHQVVIGRCAGGLQYKDVAAA